MAETIEPMTAAEYREAHREALVVWPDGFQGRTLAALEERERFLGEREALRKRAALGDLVEKIGEHPKNRAVPYPIRPFASDSVFSLDAAGLTAFLSHLDSLLPDEPEVVTGPSGNRYSMRDGELMARDAKYEWKAEFVPVEDAPVVAKLMEGAR